ncbi:MAG: gamma carbonic anhydrase family protein [Gemmatimonadetes bacterium]|nr:MAG: gamma carbonic anhydrase family protein [Gemmatimonadota bacterium]
MLYTYHGIAPKIGKNVYLAPGSHVLGDVVLGDEVSIWFNTVVRGDVHYIRIGARTNIQDNSMVHVENGRYPAIIGADVTVGHNAVIHGCTIEDVCLIGMGAIILNNATIGTGSIVAAGALVKEHQIIPPRSLVAGVPATIKRTVTDNEYQRIQASAKKYVEYKTIYIQHVEPLPGL